MKFRFLWWQLVTVLMLTGLVACAAAPQPFRMEPSAAAERQLQTRRFDDVTDAALIDATVGVLQDFGFTVKTSDVELGFISGHRGYLMSGGEIVDGFTRILKDSFKLVFSLGQRLPHPPESYITNAISVTIVVWPAPERGPKSRFLRIRFQRMFRSIGDESVVWAEDIRHPDLYQQFFAAVSKAIAIEAHALPPEPGSPN